MSRTPPTQFTIQDPVSRILDPGSRTLDPGARIQEPGSWIQDPGSWIGGALAVCNILLQGRPELSSGELHFPFTKNGRKHTRVFSAFLSNSFPENIKILCFFKNTGIPEGSRKARKGFPEAPPEAELNEHSDVIVFFNPHIYIHIC